MARPSRILIDQTALLHNVQKVKNCAPHSKVIAMVKANAYGCGIASVLPVLEGQVHAFGVACLEEALAIRALGSRSDCVLMQGVFSPEELFLVASNRFQLVIHQPHQLQWLLETPLPHQIKVWVKFNTGMHRLGFDSKLSRELLHRLAHCPWVSEELGIMTHFAFADEPNHPSNQRQLNQFRSLDLPPGQFIKSMANSAAILALDESHMDIVRPGIMLYGVSPFGEKTGRELGLLPVMQFLSALSAIHEYPEQVAIGYGETWRTTKPSRIGVVPVGYGDGYPRHIAKNTPVWINGNQVSIVGRVSMDMITVDLTEYPNLQIGDAVELWGRHIPVESIALSAGTNAYELISQITARARVDNI